jgi:hypothetical protein
MAATNICIVTRYFDADEPGLIGGLLESTIAPFAMTEGACQNPTATQKMNKNDILVTFVPAARPRLGWAVANPSNARLSTGLR